MTSRFFALVVGLAVFVSSVSGQVVSQSTPEKMTGTLIVNGGVVGTAFLVGDNGQTAVILTAAHNLPADLSERGADIVFGPGAYFDARGNFQKPLGLYEAKSTVFVSKDWFVYKDRMSGDDYLERARLDFAIIELKRSPRLGCFVMMTEQPKAERFQNAGYAKIAGGRLWQGVVTQPEFSEKSWDFYCNTLNHSDAQGASGGPFYFKKDGRWTAFAIHTGFGNKYDARQGHRRISDEILAQVIRIMNGTAELAVR